MSDLVRESLLVSVNYDVTMEAKSLFFMFCLLQRASPFCEILKFIARNFTLMEIKEGEKISLTLEKSRLSFRRVNDFFYVNDFMADPIRGAVVLIGIAEILVSLAEFIAFSAINSENSSRLIYVIKFSSPFIANFFLTFSAPLKNRRSEAALSALPRSVIIIKNHHDMEKTFSVIKIKGESC